MQRTWVALYFALAPMILFTCGCGGSSDPGPQFDTTASAPPPGPTSPPPAAASDSMPSSEDSAASTSSEGSTEEGAEEGGEEMAASGGGGMMGMPMGGMPMGGMGGMDLTNKGSSSADYGADYSAMMGGGSGMGGGGGMSLNALSQLRATEEDPAPDEDADYLTQGKYAFGTGKEKEAVEYAMAHAIANSGDSQASEVFGKTKWLTVTPPVQTVEDKDKKNAKPKTGPRPATIARFAIGIILDAPSSQTDLKPIGSKQSQNAGGGGGMMMGSGESSSNNNANAKNKERALYDVTGTFGEAIVNAFEERWNSGQ